MTEVQIWQLINDCREAMSLPQRRLWEVVRIAPHPWQHTLRTGAQVDVWAVAVFGDTVLWYNQFEEDFYSARWQRYGRIAEPIFCHTDLTGALQDLLSRIEGESRSG